MRALTMASMALLLGVSACAPSPYGYDPSYAGGGGGGGGGYQPGCTNGTGTLLGAGVGALGGGALGNLAGGKRHSGAGTLLGAVAGGLLGGVVGNASERPCSYQQPYQQPAYQQQQPYQQQQSYGYRRPSYDDNPYALQPAYPRYAPSLGNGYRSDGYRDGYRSGY